MTMIGINPLRAAARKTVNRIVKTIPSVKFKTNGKMTNAVKWVGQHISSPENRLILGVTALMSQPFIDLHNRHVDERTKEVSAARTVAKIIAGTTTGVIVRYACIAAANAFTRKPGAGVKKLSTLFYPKNSKITTKKLNKYINFMGTALSLGVMMFTNFLIDAPLTKFLTNKFISNIDNKKALKNKSINLPRKSLDEFIKSSANNVKGVNNDKC